MFSALWGYIIHCMDDERTQYVRQARRLRAQYAHRPAELHRRLRSCQPPAIRFDGDESFQPSIHRDFAAMIIARVRSGVLRYSDRRELLKAANEAGISRFDANLLIALAQHRCGQSHIIQTKRTRRWPLIIVAGLAQGVILSLYYWCLH